MTDAACKRAFVTGATGAVGETLVRQLLDRGWRVTAFHRATSNVDALKALGVDLATGDLTSAVVRAHFRLRTHLKWQNAK